MSEAPVDPSDFDPALTGPSDDLAIPFQIEGAQIRGRLVRLGPAVHQILTAHAYPEPVSRLMGEALVLTSMLGSSLKFDGTFSLQTRGDGPVGMLVVDFVTPGMLRGYASFDPADVGDQAGVAENLLGQGHMAFTIDQGQDTDRYQGVVELAGNSLTDCANQYFRQSEQIETAIQLAVGQSMTRDADGAFLSSWRAGGIMIQNLPYEGGVTVDQNPESRAFTNEEDWNRAVILMDTVGADELTDPLLAPARLLYRLFHEDGVRAFRSSPVTAACRCSADRVGNVLASYELDELQGMTEDDGLIRVTCEFCKSVYEFSPMDL
jgi:molecular chaperone Hsp33